MNVVVMGEFSGTVRDAFIALGHKAVSVDLIPSIVPGPHIQDDIRNVDLSLADLLIGHPDCTFMCNSGSKHLYIDGRKRNGRDEERWFNMTNAAMFFRWLWNLPVPRIALENPIMHKYAKQIIGVEQTQIIQPYMFGTPETKATCIWLKNLPELIPTKIMEERKPRVHFESPGMKNGLTRAQRRSITDPNIAKAMAKQWGGLQ